MHRGCGPAAGSLVAHVCGEQIQEDEPTAFVTYEKFEKKMLEVLDTQEFAPDTEDVLLQAFRVRPCHVVSNGGVVSDLPVSLRRLTQRKLALLKHLA